MLFASLGELEVVGAPQEVPYGTPERRALELHALRGLASHFGDALRQLEWRGTKEGGGGQPHGAGL